VSADVLVASECDHQIDVVGPVLSDNSWQARQADGLDIACFSIDWEGRKVTCAAGKQSVRWTEGHPHQRHEKAIIAIQFAAHDCDACPLRPRCTQAKAGPRTMTLRPREQHEALQAARKRQKTEAFKQRYAARAGIEGSLSQGIRAFGLRHTSYIGQTKTHLQHILIAIAINIVRVVAWLWEIPRATTRLSPFARLVATMT
jgi:transposase